MVQKTFYLNIRTVMNEERNIDHLPRLLLERDKYILSVMTRLYITLTKLKIITMKYVYL